MSKPVRVAALVAVAFVLGVFVGSSATDNGGVTLLGGGGDLNSEALEVIEESYFRDVDSDKLENASVQAMVEQLRKSNDDRFSHYFKPSAFARFKEVTQGRFSGVGLSVSEVKRGLRISTVFRDSPAKEAGVLKGDIVTAVEGKPIAGEDAELVTAEIKGKPGTEVTLTVLTPGRGKTRDLTLTRRELTVPAVEGNLKEANGKKVAYVRLLAFSEGAHAELRRQVERLGGMGAEGVIVDLRGNGGGLLTEAVLTSSVFVEDGVIVTTRGRTQPDQRFEAEGDALEPRPTIVLIDRDTASASEIFTAALSDAGIARVAGATSFGKGVFQEVIELDNGGALDLTVGEYLTRDGVSLAGKGIEPEIPAKDVPKTKVDEGLERALDALGMKLGS